ncbi:MAG: glycosyltransferase family 4 protein [Pseudomonadales bacterium]|nr:glycosyltransferase family 4 protein [Pseudomonadales bacterium]
MSRKNILVFTSEFPRPNNPFQGTFTSQYVKALGSRHRVRVVCPIAWFPQLRFLEAVAPGKKSTASIPTSAIVEKAETFYPRFITIPVIFRYLNAISIALCSLPTVRNLHRSQKIDAIHAHGVYPDAVAAAILAKILNIPIVITALGSDVNKEMKVKAKRWQSLKALNLASAVVGVSKHLTEVLSNYGVSKNKLHWIPTGVCRSTFAASENEVKTAISDARLENCQNTLLFVGRLHPVKAVDILIKAMNTLVSEHKGKIHLILIGDGPERSNLENMVAQLGIGNNVTFLGNQPQIKVAAWMKAASLLVLPSHMEGLPNVMLEALSLGLPVVASNVGGIPEVIDDCNGRLVEPANIEGLANAINDALLNNWDKTKIESSVSWAQWESVVEEYSQIFEHIKKLN